MCGGGFLGECHLEQREILLSYDAMKKFGHYSASAGARTWGRLVRCHTP